MKRPFSYLVAAGILSLAASPALAQDAEPAPAPAAAVDPAQDPSFSRIIDEEETIYAIQRKAFLIKNKVEVSLMLPFLMGDRFVASQPLIDIELDEGDPAVVGDESRFEVPILEGISGSVAYHLSEQFALELFGGFFNPGESETTTELLDQLQLETEQAKLTQLQGAAGLGFQWSPIYGKLQFAGLSLGNFAFYLGLGAAAGITRTQCKGTERLDPNTFDPDPAVDPSAPRCQQTSLAVAYEPSQVRFMGSFSAGFRFRFGNSLGLKAEIRDYIFTSRVYRPDANVYSDSVRNNLFFNVGVTLLFGGESN